MYEMGHAKSTHIKHFVAQPRTCEIVAYLSKCTSSNQRKCTMGLQGYDGHLLAERRKLMYMDLMYFLSSKLILQMQIGRDPVEIDV